MWTVFVVIGNNYKLLFISLLVHFCYWNTSVWALLPQSVGKWAEKWRVLGSSARADKPWKALW